MSDNIQSGVGKRRVKRNYATIDDDNNQNFELNAKDKEVTSEKSESSGEKVGNLIERTSSNGEQNKYPDTKKFKEETKNTANRDELKRFPRYNYFSKREKIKLDRTTKELELLEADAEKYGLSNLTKTEQESIITKREIINILKQKLESISSQNSFHLYDASSTQYHNNVHEKNGYHKDSKKSRQRQWEERQLSYAINHNEPNSEDIIIPGTKHYDFVFDEEAMIDYTDDATDVINEDEVGKNDYDQRLLKALQDEKEKVLTISETRKKLPVYQYREDLLKAIHDNQILIVVGETGSGKTTQLPQYLVEDGFCQNGKFQIAVTQPRRVAATSVASRVADEMNVILGQEVGYSIRFDEKTTPDKTILKYMTDGMLLREFLIDPHLSKYSCIMIDEAHERTLATDILLGLLKDLTTRRKDLRILISSATMNATKFSEFFFNCPIFNVPGRRFPVDIHYTCQPESNYLNACITTIFQIHTTQPLPGDILVFLTGQEEIEKAQENIENIVDKLGNNIEPIFVRPIYANLPQEQQELIFQKTPKNCRKVVLATNIAETSLTIDGIKFVIDSGYVKENSFIPSTGMSQLLTVPCSRASVDQRAGRAGRVGPGKCFRIFTKWSYYNELEMMPKPEIVRTNLSHTVLLLLSLGVTDLINFPLLDKPTITALKKSLEQLYSLGALNSKGSITQLGRMMCDFPCEPQYSKVINSAATHEQCKGALDECVTVVSMLHETTSLFIGKKNNNPNSVAVKGELESDHMMYLKIYNEWVHNNYSKIWCHDHHFQHKTLLRVRNIRQQLMNTCKKLGLVSKNEIALRESANEIMNTLETRVAKAFISGFSMNIAELGSNGSYHIVGAVSSSGGIDVVIHPSSVVSRNLRESGKKPYKHILYQQLMYTSREFIKDCLPINNVSLIKEMAPQLYKRLNNV
ncbi:hypothetical protein TBLA_0A06730 [Henningerozyma blattae CBS 6284]|uniref:RNA helicase n=1 Tax=Henningerozyma blattae (strain ATCC 34711 / CBS 6284 / DSM 70876 / NBRC 10599 / NRRL Y-10934 / UCD 77-7) TaxID=1071380 RepID=I2GWG3_HENB6|nr:hypothetical protein TBLA_0A06730 [Tetrapisispora blattae CBS 6284]CCH58465.1 hypothetical protein TBLA_0A06730 [Tetrapisispora blattae CBS 6284]